MIKLVFRPIEINSNLYFTLHWDGEISQNFTLCFSKSILIVKKQIFQIKILDKIKPFSNYNLHINPIQNAYLFSLKCL